MKNADFPAMPLSGDAYQDFAAYDGTPKTGYNPECQGLTKREVFALKFACALEISAPHWEAMGYVSPNVNKEAIARADALLEALEK